MFLTGETTLTAAATCLYQAKYMPEKAHQATMASVQKPMAECVS